MIEITISSKTVSSREDLFSLMKSRLPLPDYCGDNLDALHDCLTDLMEDFCIRVYKDKKLTEALGAPLAEGLCEMLTDTADENPHCKLKIKNRRRFIMSDKKNTPKEMQPSDLEKVSGGGIRPFDNVDFLPRFECDQCDMYFLDEKDLAGQICPNCHKGKLVRCNTGMSER